MTEPESPNPQTAFRIPYPRGLLRLAFRFPIVLYRLHLGWLLDRRFLLLEHRGRKSGLMRETVIEVVDHDEQAGTYVVAAAWGMKSDWYRNIAVDPGVQVTVSAHRFQAFARTLSQDEAESHLRRYATRHPGAFRQLGSLLVGEVAREAEKTIQVFVKSIPFVEFSPMHQEH